MSYYVDVMLEDVDLKEELCNQVEEINEMLKEAEWARGAFFEKYQFSSTNYTLTFEDPYNKNFNSEEFAEKIAQYVNGGTMTCKGEDGEPWRMIFDGKNNYTYQEYQGYWNKSAFEHFLETYEAELPEELKKDLEAWWIAKKI